MNNKLIVLLSLLTVFPLTASESKDMRIIAAAERPFTFVNDQQQIDGFAIEMVNNIQARMGLNIPVFNYPWARLYKVLSDQKNVVALTVARTGEREQKFHWITPIARSIHGLFALRKNQVKVSDLESAAHIGSIGVLRSDFRETELKRAGVTDIVLYNSWQQVVGALLKGRVNAIFYSSFGVNYMCPSKMPGCDEIENIMIYKVVTTYIAISKNGTDATLVEWWKKAASAFKHDKDYVHLTQKWIQYYKEHEDMELHLNNGAINIWKNQNIQNNINIQVNNPNSG